ncbi:putative leader peptide [Actinopolymorpha alba]
MCRPARPSRHDLRSVLRCDLVSRRHVDLRRVASAICRG